MKSPDERHFSGEAPAPMSADLPASKRLNDLPSRATSLLSLFRLGKNSEQIFSAIISFASSLSGVEGAALYLPLGKEDTPQQLSLIAKSDSCEIPQNKLSGAPFHYFDIISSDKTVGHLGVKAPEGLGSLIADELNFLAHFVRIVYEHQRRERIIKLHENRLEVLNQCNQLIASNMELEKITRTLSRELAFRFSADIALTLLLSENGEGLEVKGTFGCAPDVITKRIPLQNTFIGRSLRMGGMVSIPDLGARDDVGLDFLSGLAISSLQCCSIEVRGEILGMIIIGFQHPTLFDEHDALMFEEFARAVAVAIANAQYQARLTAYTERLEELVRQRTQDLERQTQRAEEANRAKSRFVANMSHELRTPLTAIIGYSSVLADGVFGSVNEKQKDALYSITRSSDHLKELIDEVLNLARIEAGKEDPEPSKIELYPLLLQVHKLMLQTAVGKGVKIAPLSIQDKDKVAKLWIDPRHVRQILLNLMSNGVKYTPQGGTVWLEIEIIGDKVKISVRDTGVGISPEKLEKLFERFERGDDQYSLAQTGTGIGLSLTKHLTEINGGRIGVTSELGVGSTFWVLIPQADASSLAEPIPETMNEDSSTFSRLDGLNILVVDDNEMAREVLETILTRVGGRAYPVATVAQAKLTAEGVPLDAALIDLAIPGESGLQLIEYFRKYCKPPLSTMPLIVVSACVFETDRQRAMAEGASFFIAKPFRPVEIIETIRDLTTSSVLNTMASFNPNYS